jgi:hypothetical protein
MRPLRGGMNDHSIPPSMDFSGRTTLTLQEIADKWACTTQHVMNLIEDGSLGAIDIKGPGAKRNLWRVPIENYRQFVATRMS